MLRKATPEGGSGTGYIHFSYLRTIPGSKWYGHLAGPPVWLQCHTSNTTKPCLDWLSYGQRVCRRCFSGRPAVLMGYVPIYRASDGKPVIVIVYEPQFAVIEQIPTHAKIIVAREGGEYDSQFIRLSLEQTPKFQTTLRERQCAYDLTPNLLKLWKDPDIVECYRDASHTARMHAMIGGQTQVQPTPLGKRPAGKLAETEFRDAYADLQPTLPSATKPK